MQCAAGTIRVYENDHGCTPITKRFRAAITTKGKRYFGSPCSNVDGAVESIQKIVNQPEDSESAPADEKAGQKRSRAGKLGRLGPPAKTAKIVQAGQTMLELVNEHEEVRTKSFEPAVSQPKGGNTNWGRANPTGGPYTGKVRLRLEKVANMTPF